MICSHIARLESKQTTIYYRLTLLYIKNIIDLGEYLHFLCFCNLKVIPSIIYSVDDVLPLLIISLLNYFNIKLVDKLQVACRENFHDTEW